MLPLQPNEVKDVKYALQALCVLLNDAQERTPNPREDDLILDMQMIHQYIYSIMFVDSMTNDELDEMREHIRVILSTADFDRKHFIMQYL